jgi:hypothetical protein
MSGEFVAKAIGIGVIPGDYEGDIGVSNLIETSRFRGKGCLSVLYSKTASRVSK